METNNYKFIPVYMSAYSSISLRPYIYFNIGEAGKGAFEFRLAYTGDLNRIQKEYTAVFRKCDSNTFYLSRFEASAESGDAGEVWEATLCPPYLKPVKLPTTARLVLGDRGLYTRLNLHPEIDGQDARGKVYFPDRSCADDLTSGEVIITEVRDKGSYGFFKGHNVKYEWPTDDQLDAYIHDHDNMWSGVLVYIKTAHFGNIIITGNRHPYGWSKGYYIQGGIGVRDGELVSVGESYMLFEQDKVCETKKVEVSDFICKRYHDCSFGELLKKFVEVPQAEKMVRWGHHHDKFISELMDEASDSAVVCPMASEQGVFFYDIRPDGIPSALSCFSKEEMDEIIKTVNQVNMAATEQIRSLVKRGKMRLDV